MVFGGRQLDGYFFVGFEEFKEVCRDLIAEDVEGRSQSCRLKLPDDCCDGLDLAGFFPVFHGFCKHMIGVVVISAEDVLVSLGGWDKEPTGGVRVNFPCCFLAGKVKFCGSLFDWSGVIALLEEVEVVCR